MFKKIKFHPCSNTFHLYWAIWEWCTKLHEELLIFVDRFRKISFSCGYTQRQRLSVLTDGGKTRRILQICEDMENKWGEDRQERQGGDKGRRGAKVLLKDGRMSDSEERLRENMRVWIVSFTASFSQRERSKHEIQLGRKWQQWKHGNSWMTSKTLEKHCFQVMCNSCHIIRRMQYSVTSITVYTITVWDESHKENISHNCTVKKLLNVVLRHCLQEKHHVMIQETWSSAASYVKVKVWVIACGDLLPLAHW